MWPDFLWQESRPGPAGLNRWTCCRFAVQLPREIVRGIYFDGCRSRIALCEEEGGAQFEGQITLVSHYTSRAVIYPCLYLLTTLLRWCRSAY